MLHLHCIQYYDNFVFLYRENSNYFEKYDLSKMLMLTSHSVQTCSTRFQQHSWSEEFSDAQSVNQPRLLQLSCLLLPLPHRINGLAVTELQMISVHHYLFNWDYSLLSTQADCAKLMDLELQWVFLLVTNSSTVGEFSKYYLNSTYSIWIVFIKISTHVLSSLVLLQIVSWLCCLILDGVFSLSQMKI